MTEEADYTNWRVMVDDAGKVLRDEEEGGYCVWNVEDQSVVILPPDDDSTNLIAHLLLRPTEETTQSVLKIAVQTESEDDTPPTPKKETNDKATNYWLTRTPNVEGCSNCTELLILIVGTYLIQKMLNDKKSDKKRVWQIVAKKMNECGYRVPGRSHTQQGEEVFKKWEQLRKAYFKFETNETYDRPPYFHALDNVLGKKDVEVVEEAESDAADSRVMKSPDIPLYVETVDTSQRVMSPTLVCQIIQDLAEFEGTLSPKRKPTKDEIINFWSTETPDVEGCKNCTELMISFVGEDLIQELINNKTISQKKVWQYIAKVMSDHGYRVPGQTLEEQGEKVYQKWKNMGRMYAKCKELASVAQVACRDPPSYFDALDRVIQRLQRTDNTKLILNSFSNLSEESAGNSQSPKQEFVEDEISGNESNKPTKEDIVNYWATETPDIEGCRNCTELLIMFVGEDSIQDMFNDKKSCQKKVWQYIAKIMGEYGYMVPGQTLEDQGEKVYQKWKNMGRMYAKYKDHVYGAESPYKDPPLCFDALDKVVKRLQQSDKQKVLLSVFINSRKTGTIEDDTSQTSKLFKEEHAESETSLSENTSYKPTKDEIITYWLTKTPDIEDCKNCTELLIKIAGDDSIQKLLTNRKTSKKKVWQIVASRLNNLGYKVPGFTLDEQGEKVYQKWKNMGNSYMKFKSNLLQTGIAHKNPPAFFDALDKVLSKVLYTVHPKLLLDSFSDLGVMQESEEDSQPEVIVSPAKPTPAHNLLQPSSIVKVVVKDSTTVQCMKDEPTSYWLTETPNIEGCKNCAELLILIVGEKSIQKMLRDNIVPKKKVWQVVAKMLSDYGYKVPGLTIGLQGERVHQKWRNMEKVYFKYKEYIGQTAEVYKDPPSYFDLMDKAMRMKHLHHTPKAVQKNDSDVGTFKPSNSSTFTFKQHLENEPISFWLTETPNIDGCKNCTELLIGLVGNKSVLKTLNSRVGPQKRVWQMIAKKMCLHGYKVPGRNISEQGEKVRDKWRSIEKVYRKYKSHLGHSKQSRKFFPPYFDAMDKVLGKRRGFSSKQRPIRKTADSGEQKNDSESESSTASAAASHSEESKEASANQSFWLAGTPNLENIKNTTELLIMIVGDEGIQKMLYNKKTVARRKVWQIVVNRMEEYGCVVPGSTTAEQAEKVRQKWRSMEKVYLKYKDYVNQTGHARKFFPYYYDAMYKVLGMKQVVRPKRRSVFTQSSEKTSIRIPDNENPDPVELSADSSMQQHKLDELHSYWLTKVSNVEGVKNLTELLIKIMGQKKMQNILKSKNSAKKKIWQLIALKMAKYGHIIPGMTVAEQGERVRDKWKNMEKSYTRHKEHTNQMEESWENPYYFDAMDVVMSEQYENNCPKLLLGSVCSLTTGENDIWSNSNDEIQTGYEANGNNRMELNETDTENEDNMSESISTVPAVPTLKTKYRKHKENYSFMSKNQECFITELKDVIIEECTKEREAEELNHKEITHLLKRQNQQRDNMLFLLRQLIEKTNSLKRRRSESDLE